MSEKKYISLVCLIFIFYLFYIPGFVDFIFYNTYGYLLESDRYKDFPNLTHYLLLVIGGYNHTYTYVLDKLLVAFIFIGIWIWAYKK